MTFRDSNPEAWAAGRARAREERDAALPGMRAAIRDLEAKAATNDPALYTTHENGRTSSHLVDLEVLRYGVTQIEAAVLRELEDHQPQETTP